MAQEIRIVSRLRAAKGYTEVERKVGLTTTLAPTQGLAVNWTGTRYSADIQDVSDAAHELVTVGADIATPGFGIFRNVSLANTIKLGVQAAVVATPAAPTVTPQGTSGATTYSYRVSAIDANGETLAGTAGATATGHATLDGTNFNRLTWAAVANATGYKVYGRSAGTELLIATLGDVLTYDDTGVVTPAGALPSVNSTGFQPFASMLPGEPAGPFRLTTKNIYAKGVGGTAQLEHCVLEA